ncbi:MAG: hypothetical protein DLM61_27670 [Pseudonocardiales bacterium]|nr:MAG: hypothetical protein DLM61_27670 [Pseudonocardiales bacterium]
MRSLVQVQLGPLKKYHRGRRRFIVKKIMALLLVGLVALIVVQRQRSAKAEADLWREATAPNS